ncbi:AAA family ATPase [Jiangella alkaliphila]|uniref:ATPase family associated with various cellular activities (AAA) n=1 Tax=Jiangella alkaliphila TaxID=419479 RepID=A0A1H2L3J0_9ACTN|nr:ATP-binding protein [Jiangella alkaliphila]SDU75161.1 ATPase family associated with various cellular activities (AAA) [Jiangella alkaliphila]
MDDETRRFVTTFREFMTEVVNQVRAESGDVQPLLPVLEEHLGVPPRSVPVVVEQVSPLRFADADVALEALAARQGGRRLIGVGGGMTRRHASLAEIIENAGLHGMFPVGPVDYARVPTGPDSSRQVVAFGLHLFSYDGVPLVVLQRSAQPQLGRELPELEVLAASDAVVPAFLDELHRLMAEHSVLRGQVVTFAPAVFGASNGEVTFLRRPELTADDVVLPDGLLARVERHLTGVARHRDALRAAGQHLKRGVLLFGPPGTGKTHTVRYFMAVSPGTTVIVLSGRSLRLVQVAAETARALEPAVVVLEDCDLIAEDRSLSDGPQPLLFEALDALDGLADDADVAFVLTTNRADLLEPALAQRPGRVDLAAEIPLPDGASRRRLNRLYARDLPFSASALDETAERAEGTTASFAKELMRRAVLGAADAGHPPGDADLSAALDEMLSDTEALSRSLFGGATDDPGGGPGGFGAGGPQPGLAPL